MPRGIPRVPRSVRLEAIDGASRSEPPFTREEWDAAAKRLYPTVKEERIYRQFKAKYGFKDSLIIKAGLGEPAIGVKH